MTAHVLPGERGRKAPSTAGRVIPFDQTVELYREWLELDAETERLSDLPDVAFYESEVDRLCRIEDRIRAMTATTLEALAAQARILAEGCNIFGEPAETALAVKIADTLDRMAGEL